MVKLHAQNSGVELLRAYPENLDELTGDKRACTQILVNLLSNAIKFTPRNGTVTISVRPEPQALLIVVADTGIGIAERDLARLGDPFFQAKTSGRNENGTGLGLSIVRGLVGLQGGTIAVASEPDKGTCVHVLLPLDGVAARTGIPAKIQTIPDLPRSDKHDLQDSNDGAENCVKPWPPLIMISFCANRRRNCNDCGTPCGPCEDAVSAGRRGGAGAI